MTVKMRFDKGYENQRVSVGVFICLLTNDDNALHPEAFISR